MITAQGIRDELTSYVLPTLVAVASIVGGIVAILSVDDTTLRSLLGVGSSAIVAAVLGFRIGVLVGRRDSGVATWPGSGVTGVVRRQEISQRQPLTQEIASANSIVLAAGATLGQLKLEAELIQRKIKEGCAFRLIVPDPSDPNEFAALAALFGSLQGLATDLATSLESFKQVYKSVGDQVGQGFEVRLAPPVFIFSVIMIDNAKGNINVYLTEKSPQERLCIEFHRGHVLTMCRAHFEWVWNRSEVVNTEGDLGLAQDQLHEIRSQH